MASVFPWPLKYKNGRACILFLKKGELWRLSSPVIVFVQFQNDCSGFGKPSWHPAIRNRPVHAENRSEGEPLLQANAWLVDVSLYMIVRRNLRALSCMSSHLEESRLIR
jgi:hypothetical protein